MYASPSSAGRTRPESAAHPALKQSKGLGHHRYSMHNEEATIVNTVAGLQAVDCPCFLHESHVLRKYLIDRTGRVVPGAGIVRFGRLAATAHRELDLTALREVEPECALAVIER